MAPQKTKSQSAEPRPKTLVVPAIRGRVLGINVYRGFARVCDLADLSVADVYDQKDNPIGTQRDLNAAHARDAHEYVKTRDLGFWTGVFLCAWLKSAETFTLTTEEELA